MRVSLVAMTTLFLACSSSKPLGNGAQLASEFIGPNGGIVTLPDGSSVSVPPGALDQEVTLSMQSVTGVPVPAIGTSVGLTYRVGPEGQTFDMPVTVTLAFDPTEIPSGKSAKDIVVYTAPREATDYYTPLPTTLVDSLHVAVTTTHFSYFVPVSTPPSGTYDVWTTSEGVIGLKQGSAKFGVASTGPSPCPDPSNDESRVLERAGAGPAIICVNDSGSTTYQTVKGFGASITDSAAYDIQNGLDESERDRLLEALFDAKTGLGLTLLRQPLGASDFTHDMQSYSLRPAASKSFSIAHDVPYIIKTIKEARGYNASVEVIGTAWSAPPWMKTKDTMNDPGGDVILAAGMQKDYVQYLVDAVDAYAAAGAPISYLTPLNEPGEGENYPGMDLSETDEESLIRELRTKLDGSGHKNVRILGYDFDLTKKESAGGKLNPFALLGSRGTRDDLYGLAFHCYGDPSPVTSMSTLRNLYDSKHFWVTECTSTWDDEDALDGKGPVSHGHGEAIEQLIRAMRNGSETFLTWNVALGPDLKSPRRVREHVGTGCTNCVGLVRIENGSFTPERDFAEIGHASKFVKPGAKVIYSGTYNDVTAYMGSSSDPRTPPPGGRQSAVEGWLKNPKSKSPPAGGIEDVAFHNPSVKVNGKVQDGGYVLVVYNSDSNDQAVQVRWNEYVISYPVPKRSAVTFTWGASVSFTSDVSGPTPPPPPPPLAALSAPAQRSPTMRRSFRRRRRGWRRAPRQRRVSASSTSTVERSRAPSSEPAARICDEVALAEGRASVLTPLLARSRQGVTTWAICQTLPNGSRTMARRSP
jgi:O-glycosyl hydrolase